MSSSSSPLRIDAKRSGIFSTAVILGLIAIATCAQATPLTGTVLTAPGFTVTPGLIPPGTPAGTLLASLVSPYSFATTGGTTSGTIISAVYKNSSGTLDFYYQVMNSATSATAIARVTDTSFAGFTTWTGFRTDAVGPFAAGSVVYITADSDALGNVLGFSFNPPNTAKILPGLTSDIMVISTNATAFTAGNTSVIDGGAVTVAALEPSSAGPPGPLTITTTSVAGGTVGKAYSQTLTATGGSPPYLWSIIAGRLPAGLTLNRNTGQIAGTPIEEQTAIVTIQVTDSSSPPQTATTVLVFTIGL